jgi:hypothetical protein
LGQPQVPPQPSGLPQLVPHWGVQATHVLLSPQIWPVGHAPQEPPQPSLPQTLPAQLGAHAGTHWNWPLQ